jgi:hypothetical protein
LEELSGGKYETVTVTDSPALIEEFAAGSCRITVFGGWNELVSRVTTVLSRKLLRTPRASGSDIPTRSGVMMGVVSRGGWMIRALTGGGSAGIGGGWAMPVSMGCSAGDNVEDDAGAEGCGAGGTILVGRTKIKITT